MPAKQVLFKGAARTRIIAGVNILADAVKVNRYAKLPPTQAANPRWC